jgi:peptidoglycan hydrolase-like protein with peptidoglycan-binding domain
MRRLLIPLLALALVGTMVGVGVAALQRPNPVQVLGESSPGETKVAEVASGAPSSGKLAGDRADLEAERAAAEAAAAASEAAATATPAPYDVAAVQQRLTDLRYYVGPIDGKAGADTRSAVVAFQKVNGLTADGVVGPITQAALAAPGVPELQGGAPDRLEVDLTKQVLYLVVGNALQRIMPVSSGSGETYETKDGGTARSLTPIGTYRIERHIRGERVADLGTLYDPMYFYRGWAIHGSNSVPPYPASHGCVRVTRPDAIWLFDRVPIGMQVVLYGGTHTFGAGSAAAGTNTPAGDTAEDIEPPPPSPAPPPPPSATPKPSTQPPPRPSTPAPSTPRPSTPGPSTPPPSSAPPSTAPPSAPPPSTAPPSTAPPSTAPSQAPPTPASSPTPVPAPS